jgi:sugar lactone lactonase YvrE
VVAQRHPVTFISPIGIENCAMKKVPFYLVVACGLLLAFTTSVYSQPITFNTLAGYAGRGSRDGSASKSQFNHPHGIAVDNAGNLYIADTGNHVIRKMTSSGFVTTIAGLAGVSGSDDGAGSTARFLRPQGVAVDSGGNLYVADTGNHTIRHIAPTGTVSTLAGLAGVIGNESGYANDARFNQPLGVTVDSSGIVYVADYGNSAIRKIIPASVVGTLAVSDGPQGLAIDSDNNVYVADYASSTILKITSSGNVSTLAGLTNSYGSIDEAGGNARFYYPAAVTVDSAKNVYVADTFNNTIRKITPLGSVSTLAGSAGNYGSIDGTNSAARFLGPEGIAVDSAGNVFVADTQNSTIRKIRPNGAVSTLAGSASNGSVEGTQRNARFDWPAAVAADSAGNVFVADTENSTIRKIAPTGAASTLAGAVGDYGSANGTGSAAQFYGPQGIAVDSADNIFVADTGNHTIRKITPEGVVSTFAGSADDYGSADGMGSNAQFFHPQGLAADSADNLYVADTWNHTIRKITSAGLVTTLAGMAENYGSANGTNSNARFYWPAGIAVDSAGNLYVADYFNHTIRRILPIGTNWVTSTLAGMAAVSGKSDGTNSNARFFQPQGIAVNNSGHLYIVDSGNHTIRKVAAVGTNWIISSVAGLVGTSGSADGTGSAAQFYYPAGIAVDGSGYFYVADSGNNTIRLNRFVPPLLEVSLLPNQAILYWPVSASGFVVETASTLAPGAVWSSATNGLTLSGDNYTLPININGPAGFYRLRKP